MPRSNMDQKEKLEVLFKRADEQYEKGNFKSAFRLCLIPAKRGNLRSQLALGYFYKNGIGVKPNRDLALYWTRRAYRQGSAAAAHNIALIFRDEGRLDRALAWFERAVKLHDGDASLEIAKIYLDRGDTARAIERLKEALRTDPIRMLSESRDEAKRLLKRLTAGKPATKIP
jgi:uncharacterized protein